MGKRGVRNESRRNVNVEANKEIVEELRNDEIFTVLGATSKLENRYADEEEDLEELGQPTTNLYGSYI